MSDGDEIKINLKKSLEIFKNKKVMGWAAIIILLILTIWGASIRTQNLPLLKDSTTDEYIPLALDPYYFLRVAETMLDGPLGSDDNMRNPAVEVPYTKEILPEVVVFMYKVAKVFDPDVTIQYINVISPVILFALGLIVFYFLCYSLTRSKLAAIIASAFLAFIPPFLYRTTAGFSDHEAIGMLAFFLGLLFLSYTLRRLQNNVRGKNWKEIFYYIILPLTTTLTLLSWAGAAKFLFTIIPVSYGIMWILEANKEGAHKKLKRILFSYTSWAVLTFVFLGIAGFNIISVIKNFAFGFSGIATPILFLFIIVDYILITKRFNLRGQLSKIAKDYRILLSAVITFIIGAVVYQIFIGDIFGIIGQFAERLVDPWGSERITLTVAENKQPYLNDWIGQIGKSFFWLFFAGMVFFGYDFSRRIHGTKYKLTFIFAWVVLISGILFSRISESSVLNGNTFVSKLLYFVAALIFVISIIYIYRKSILTPTSSMIVIFTWLIPMLIATRGAIRLFFVIAPVVAFMVGYLIYSIIGMVKRNKDETVRFFTIVAILTVVVLSFLALISFINTSSAQSKFTGPSANIQWQSAMSWVRDNTPEGSIFVHWWDYGYWTQYLGERPSVTDGGHVVPYWDHLVGRYVLTTPQPETALSFMKTHDVSYLLIDPTDIGKYPAYSKIGSDEKGSDRYSWIQPLVIDQTQTQETRTGTVRFYRGGIVLDEDIIYNQNGTEIFLPESKAGLGAVIIEVVQSETGEVSVTQPQGIYVYNNKQYNIPIRYFEYDGNFNDYGTGVEATIKMIPFVSSSGNSLQVDNLGSMIYLSPKVSPSLFAQIYLMNDPQELYPTVSLAHSELDPVVSQLNAQGANFKDFVYYQGIRGPIKIYEINYPENILEKEEFLRTAGKYGELDNIKLTS